MGDYARAIEYGLQSINLGTRTLSQPALAGCYTNLAEAYALAGTPAKATDYMELAADWVKKERSWSANVDFFSQGACVALVLGNVGLALTLIDRMEELASGRERIVPNPGTFIKLQIFRAAHVSGAGAASRIVADAKAKFQRSHPLHYLTVTVAGAWLEKHTSGALCLETQAELRVLDAPKLAGFRALQLAQGFLT